MPLLVIGLVVLLILGYREAQDEAKACRDAKIFAWFQSEMSAEDAVVRDLRPSIPDADRATQFLTLGLEYESAAREYRVLAEIVAEEQSDWLPWHALVRSLQLRAARTQRIAAIYRDMRDGRAVVGREGAARRIRLADAALLRQAREVLRGQEFDVEPDGRFVVRC